jgi:S-adenosylmethionine/arginine decarboxylase-like enzyme
MARLVAIPKVLQVTLNASACRTNRATASGKAVDTLVERLKSQRVSLFVFERQSVEQPTPHAIEQRSRYCR